MSLIFILILAFLNSLIKSQNYTVYGSITKEEPIVIPLSDSNKDNCIYLDAIDFDSEIKEIEIYVTVYSGDLNEKYMHYGSERVTPKKNQIVKLPQAKYYDHFSSTKSSNSDYDDNTYYFIIPKTSSRYLYLSVPKAKIFASSEFKIEIGVRKGFPIWAIILIVIVTLMIIGGIIGIILYIRKRNKNKNNNSLLINDNDYNQPISNEDAIAST